VAGREVEEPRVDAVGLGGPRDAAGNGRVGAVEDDAGCAAAEDDGLRNRAGGRHVDAFAVHAGSDRHQVAGGGEVGGALDRAQGLAGVGAEVGVVAAGSDVEGSQRRLGQHVAPRREDGGALGGPGYAIRVGDGHPRLVAGARRQPEEAAGEGGGRDAGEGVRRAEGGLADQAPLERRTGVLVAVAAHRGDDATGVKGAVGRQSVEGDGLGAGGRRQGAEDERGGQQAGPRHGGQSSLSGRRGGGR
jgi:hypothetical protein